MKKRMLSGLLALVMMTTMIGIGPMPAYGETLTEPEVEIEVEAEGGTDPEKENETEGETDVEPKRLEAPSLQIANVPSSGKLKISWEPVEGAASYVVYRGTAKTGPFAKKTTVTATSYTDTTAKAGTRYYYKVRARGADETVADSPYSKYVYRCCDLPRPVLKTSSRISDAKPYLYWKEVAGAAKYEIYVSKTKNGTYSRITTTKDTSYGYAKAKAGQKYYFKIIAVSKKTTAANSAFSLPKSRTCGAPYIVSSTDSKYVYKDFKKDMKQLIEKYPAMLSKTYLGKTIDDRGLYALTLGNPDAEKQIFVTAGFHAREYINCQLVMRMVENYCRTYKTGSYQGVPYTKLFDQVCIRIIPMANPDGIAISAYGPSAINDKTIRAKVKKIPKERGYYFWKANARGVDLNNNYIIYRGTPDNDSFASEGYPGPKSFSELETKAVLKALESCGNVQAVINYHSMGNCIYWGYHNKQYKAACKAFVSLFQDMTGYYLIDESDSDKARGDFEHYIMHEYKIPYVCIENGKSTVPVPNSEFKTIYQKNKNGFAVAAYHFYEE